MLGTQKSKSHYILVGEKYHPIEYTIHKDGTFCGHLEEYKGCFAQGSDLSDLSQSLKRMLNFLEPKN